VPNIIKLVGHVVDGQVLLQSAALDFNVTQKDLLDVKEHAVLMAKEPHPVVIRIP